jgi:hypothetical protein
MPDHNFHHMLDIFVQFVIPKSQHMITLGPQQRIPSFVFLRLFVRAMLVAVEFYRDLGAVFDEIEEIELERRLPAEMVTDPFEFAQSVP